MLCLLKILYLLISSLSLSGSKRKNEKARESERKREREKEREREIMPHFSFLGPSRVPAVTNKVHKFMVLQIFYEDHQFAVPTFFSKNLSLIPIQKHEILNKHRISKVLI